MKSPAEDLASYLDTNHAVDLWIGTNLFVSEQPDAVGVDDEVVMLYDTGGQAPELNYTWLRPTVQVKVRGGRGDYAKAYALAEIIRDELHGLTQQTLGNTRYAGVVATSDILFVTRDDNGRPVFTINFQVHRTTTS